MSTFVSGLVCYLIGVRYNQLDCGVFRSSQQIDVRYLGVCHIQPGGLHRYEARDEEMMAIGVCTQ